MKEFITKYGWPILAILFLLLFLGRGCTSSKINKTNTNISLHDSTSAAHIDALTIRIQELEDNAATSIEVRDMMELVMLDFLIYEDDLDKGKTSLSQIKDKIEANDKLDKTK